MDWKKLLTNAVLAGFWAAVAVVTASDQPLSKAAITAAVVAAVRVAVGYVAARVGKPVPVDA